MLPELADLLSPTERGNGSVVLDDRLDLRHTDCIHGSLLETDGDKAAFVSTRSDGSIPRHVVANLAFSYGHSPSGSTLNAPPFQPGDTFESLRTDTFVTSPLVQKRISGSIEGGIGVGWRDRCDRGSGVSRWRHNARSHDAA